jgi:hypothetical protein
MEHLEKLRTNERLPNKAQLNDEGVEYAITQTKDIYLKLSREEHHRKRVFSSIVREYLNWANAVAKQDDERAKHGSEEILSRRK